VGRPYCGLSVLVFEHTNFGPHAVSSSGQHVLLYVGIHSAPQCSVFLGQNFVLSFSVCLSSPSINTTPELPPTFSLFGQCSEQQGSKTFSRWLAQKLPLQSKWAAARLPSLPALHPLHKIHILPHCFTSLLSGFKALLCTWHTCTLTSLSPDRVLHLNILSILGAVLACSGTVIETEGYLSTFSDGTYT